MKLSLLGSSFALSLSFGLVPGIAAAVDSAAAVTASGVQVTPATEPGPSGGMQRTAAQLDQLLGPIALYPDALIALILPSATEASDVVLAARYFATDGDANKVDDQPWDDSVRALAHYPDVIKWMDENLAWTKQVGEAFLEQPADVMKSVQRLRVAARAAGTLVDTPQQRVVTTDEAITIVPAQPEVIYVPSYDPEIVYLQRRDYFPGPFLTFGAGYATGFWLGYDLDWSRHRLWVMNRYERERYWRQHRQVPAVVVVRPDPRWEHDGVHHIWRPSPGRVRPFRPITGPSRTVVVRPAPFNHDNYRHDGPRPPAASSRPDAPQLPRPPFDRGGQRWGSESGSPPARVSPDVRRDAPRLQPPPPDAVQGQPSRQIPARPAPSAERTRDQRWRGPNAEAKPGQESPRHFARPAPTNSTTLEATRPGGRSVTNGPSHSAPRANPAPERSAPPPKEASPAVQSPPPTSRSQEVPAEARRSLYGR